MLDFTEAKLGIVQAGIFAVTGEVAAGLAEHFRRHVHADGAAGGTNFATGDEYVEAAATAKVEHGFAGFQRDECGGITAGKPMFAPSAVT